MVFAEAHALFLRGARQIWRPVSDLSVRRYLGACSVWFSVGVGRAGRSASLSGLSSLGFLDSIPFPYTWHFSFCGRCYHTICYDMTRLNTWMIIIPRGCDLAGDTRDSTTEQSSTWLIFGGRTDDSTQFIHVASVWMENFSH